MDDSDNMGNSEDIGNMGDEDGVTEAGTEGYTAMADQMTTAFGDITADLMHLYKSIAAMVHDYQAQNPDKTMIRLDGPKVRQIKAQITRLLIERLVDPNEPQKVFNYILYLIDSLADAQQTRVTLCRALNELATDVNVMADLLGMAPLVGSAPAPQEGLSDSGDFITGAGQKIVKMHAPDQCEGFFCVVHKPLPGPWDTWPTRWNPGNVLDSWCGFERVCPHGMGHTAVEETLRGNEHPHNCCGHCPCAPPKAQPVYGADGALERYT